MKLFLKLFIGLFLIFMFIGCKDSTIKITVHNESSENIHNIKLIYFEESKSIKMITAKNNKSIVIHPEHDSDLQVIYTNSKNKRIDSKIDIYFGPGGYEGTIDIFINQNGIENVKNNISIK